MSNETNRILELTQFVWETYYTGDIESRAQYIEEREELREQLTGCDECPYCGSDINVPDWDDIEDSGIHNCPICDNDFNYETEKITRFSTSRI